MFEENKTWDEKTGCRYLAKKGFQWRCGLLIGATPETAQAMTDGMGVGAGCSSPLFNPERNLASLRLALLYSSASPSTLSAIR